jgi:hypothetical protein
MCEWTNHCFIQFDGVTIGPNHYIVKIYSFKSGTGINYKPTIELDLSHVYFHWDLSISTANGYIWEMMAEKEANYIKEYPLDSMKVGGIVSCKKSVHI